MTGTIASLADKNLVTSSRSSDALDAAKRLVINYDRSRLAAGQFLKLVKGLQAEVKRDREDERLSAKATLDAIVAGRNKHLVPLQQAESIVKAKQLADEDEQNRKRREKQAELNRQREEERAELNRKAQEEAEEMAALHAAEIEEAGDVEQAAAIREAPIELAPITLPDPIVIPDLKPKIDGQHTVTHWKCRLVNLDAVPRGLLQFDQVAANRWVAGIKDEIANGDTSYGRGITDKSKIAEIAEMPNGTVLTAEILGVDVIPGIEIFTEKTRASRSY